MNLKCDSFLRHWIWITSSDSSRDGEHRGPGDCPDEVRVRRARPRDQGPDCEAKMLALKMALKMALDFLH